MRKTNCEWNCNFLVLRNMKTLLNKILLHGFLIFILTFVMNAESKAQTYGKSDYSKFNLYADIGTNIFVSSAFINLEYTFFHSKSGLVHLNSRLGGGGAAIFWGSSGLGGLGGINVLIGEKSHHFESGAGLFIGSDYDGSDGTFYIPYFELGYRYQKPTGGFLFRAKAGILGVGLSLGYAF